MVSPSVPGAFRALEVELSSINLDVTLAQVACSASSVLMAGAVLLKAPLSLRETNNIDTWISSDNDSVDESPTRGCLLRVQDISFSP